MVILRLVGKGANGGNPRLTSCPDSYTDLITWGVRPPWLDRAISVGLCARTVSLSQVSQLGSPFCRYMDFIDQEPSDVPL